MIEITFDESTCIGLKIAQHYGEGEFSCGVAGVFAADGGEITQEEMDQIQQEIEAEERRAWERGRPLGGNACDVYEFSLALDTGDVSEIEPGQKRQKILERLGSAFWEENALQDAKYHVKKAKKNLQSVRKDIAAGEPLRIWYSDSPGDLCGLYWFMAQIEPLLEQCGEISLLKLPQWEYDEETDTFISHRTWGEVDPGQYHRYLSQKTPAPAPLCKNLASKWKTLQQENAPLRAVVNGHLFSVPETFYDDFIGREIEAEEGQFHESAFIGRMLDKYQLGISDSLIALRIEAMIQDRRLEVVEDRFEEDMPKTHKILRKRINASLISK